MNGVLTKFFAFVFCTCVYCRRGWRQMRCLLYMKLFLKFWGTIAAARRVPFNDWTIWSIDTVLCTPVLLLVATWLYILAMINWTRLRNIIFLNASGAGFDVSPSIVARSCGQLTNIYSNCWIIIILHTSRDSNIQAKQSCVIPLIVWIISSSSSHCSWGEVFSEDSVRTTLSVPRCERLGDWSLSTIEDLGCGPVDWLLCAFLRG